MALPLDKNNNNSTFFDLFTIERRLFKCYNNIVIDDVCLAILLNCQLLDIIIIRTITYILTKAVNKTVYNMYV